MGILQVIATLMILALSYLMGTLHVFKKQERMINDLQIDNDAYQIENARLRFAINKFNKNSSVITRENNVYSLESKNKL